MNRYVMVGTFKETGSGVSLDRAERKRAMAQARASQQHVDAPVAVTHPGLRDGAAPRTAPALVTGLSSLTR